MNKVTELRRSKGMTQEQFAEYCGVSRISIARYEADAAISRENAIKVSSACNVSIDYLLNCENENRLIMAEEAPAYLSSEEAQLIADFRKLSPRGQKRVIESILELNIVYPREKKTRNSSDPAPDE